VAWFLILSVILKLETQQYENLGIMSFANIVIMRHKCYQVGLIIYIRPISNNLINNLFLLFLISDDFA
jgi:hypothetical protein